MQEVPLQKADDLDVLRAAESGELAEALRQAADQPGKRVVDRLRLGSHVLAQDPDAARGIAEADAVAVERIVEIGETAPVEAGEEGARPLDVAREKLVQPREQQWPQP